MSNIFPMTTIRNNFDKDFDSLLSYLMPVSGRTTRFTNVSTTPRANVIKQAEGYTIELAAPGFSRDEFNIGVDNGVLSIHVGTSDVPGYGDQLTTQEFSNTSYTRSLSLP